MTTKARHGLTTPVVVRMSQTGGNGSYVREVGEPLPTITTKNDMCVVIPEANAYVVPNFGERDGQEPRVHDVDEPVPTVTSRGAGNLVSPMLAEARSEYGDVDPRRLVEVNGQPYLLDIRYRMLQNPELARAMGFSDEESTYEFVGNVTEITKQIGNAVPVRVAAALVKAVLGPANKVESDAVA